LVSQGQYGTGGDRQAEYHRHLADRRHAGAAWTDAAILGRAGIPTILFGPGGAGLHSPHGYVRLNEVLACRDALGEEYRQREPRGYRYSWYCELYGQWRGRADLSMRQVHRAGEITSASPCSTMAPTIRARTRAASRSP